MSEWILATHNQGKLREFITLVAPYAIALRSAGELGLPEPEETGDSFEANAALKAEAAAQASGKPALADDSGLVVPDLGGAPGIYSARWAGPGKDFGVAMQRIHDELAAQGDEMEGTPAYFVCVIAVARPGQPTLCFRGEAHGALTYPPRGTGGFGYNPVFVAEGHDKTFAEMDDDERYAITHRKVAFDAFVAWLQQEQAA